VDAATAAGCLRLGHVDDPLLSVVHVDDAFRHAMADDGTPDQHAIGVHAFHPVVVGHTDRGGVLGAEPDGCSAAGQRQHEQVVLIFGVDRPLVVGSEVADGHLFGAIRAERWLTEEPVHIKRWTVGWQRLTKITHPVVIKEEMHPASQCVPRLEPLNIDGEWGIAAATGLRARPLRRGDHRNRCLLSLGKGDPLFLRALGKISEVHTGALLQGPEPLDGKFAVRGSGKSEDGLG
jgi:hypothetical protein